MRIYNKKEFLKLPPGTFFCHGEPFVFYDLSVKAKTIGNDFFYIDLTRIKADDSGELVDNMDKMLEEHASFELSYSEGRDGTFDDKQIFLVYEIEDLKKIREFIDETISKTGNI